MQDIISLDCNVQENKNRICTIEAQEIRLILLKIKTTENRICGCFDLPSLRFKEFKVTITNRFFFFNFSFDEPAI